jgi:thiamine kinase-like enzyme
LLLEDCSDFEVRDLSTETPTTPKELMDVVRAGARLHARWWNTDKLHGWSWLMSAGTPEWASFCELVQSGWLVFLESEACSHAPLGGRLLAEGLSQKFAKLARRGGRHSTLTHLDFRIDNMLFEPQAEDPVLLLDWQGAREGVGACDLAFLLGTGYTPEFRRQHEQAVLDTYYLTLIEEGVRDYSREDFKEDCRYAMLFALWGIPLSMGNLDLSSERAQILLNKAVTGMMTAALESGAQQLLAEL